MEKKAKPTFERSVETDLLIDFLNETEIGDVITYEEIAEACGVDVRDKRHVKTSACRVLLNEKHKSFATINKVGLKHIDHGEVIDQAKAGTKRVYRVAKRERNKLVRGVENLDALDREQKQEYTTQRAMLEMLRFAAQKGEKRVRSIAYASDHPLPVQKTIEALKNGKEGEVD